MKSIFDRLAEENPKAVTCRCSKDSLAVYDYEKMVRVLMRRDKMGREEAEEYLDFNVVGAWVGEGTPIILFK